MTDYLTIDFNSHTKECDTLGCPNGWLISWSDDIEMLEPFANAYKCHTYGFVTNKRMYGNTTGNYWNYNYPKYLNIHYEPPEIEIRGEILGVGYLKSINENDNPNIICPRCYPNKKILGVGYLKSINENDNPNIICPRCYPNKKE